jgi:hypothetical protein
MKEKRMKLLHSPLAFQLTLPHTTSAPACDDLQGFPPGVRDERFSPPDRQTLSKVKNLVLGLE